MTFNTARTFVGAKLNQLPEDYDFLTNKMTMAWRSMQRGQILSRRRFLSTQNNDDGMMFDVDEEYYFWRLNVLSIQKHIINIIFIYNTEQNGNAITFNVTGTFLRGKIEPAPRNSDDDMTVQCDED